MTPEEVNELMRRCPQPAIDAAVAFQTSRDPALVSVIVLGIIERFVEPDARPKVHEAKADTRLFDDLGVDSLLMVEIVMTIEGVLAVRAPDEELRTLRTIGDVQTYLDAKLRGTAWEAPAPVMDAAAIAAILPQQPPFLFLTSASVAGGSAKGSYAITGAEDALKGHFKSDPVFPASLMVEALGQLACLFILKSNSPDFVSAKVEGRAWFASAEVVRCQRICRPGDTLSLSVKLLRVRAPLATFSGSIEVNGEKTAAVEELTLAFGPLVPPAAPVQPNGDAPACAAS
jgi:3-hydroxyacyl-[acyl-carrier-protein] dehydratase